MPLSAQTPFGSLQPISILFNAASLLGDFGKNRRVVLDVLNVVGKIQVDATMHEVHDAELDVTQHPVEVGPDVTDHIRVKPRTLQIEGIITDSPINETELGAVIAAASAAFPTVGGINALAAGNAIYSGVTNALVQRAGLTRSQEAYDALQRIVDARQTIDIDTPLRYWKDLAIERLSVRRDPQTGRALFFAASFREIIRISTKTENLPVTSPAAPLKKDGHKQGAAASKPLYDTSKSAAKNIRDWIFK